MDKETHIGIILNTSKEEAIRSTHKIVDLLKKAGLEYFLLREEAMKCDLSRVGLEKEDFLKKISYLLTIGGDGTLLRGARLVGGKNIPILGINMGRMGFLTQTNLENFPDLIPLLKENKFSLERRKGLITEIKGETIFSLNDSVILRKNPFRIIELKVSINGEYLTTFSADGLIVSTPTGSTAHSLSAGGPILHPEVEGIIIIPICPHTLSHRPLVIPSSSSIEVLSLSPGGVSVVCDGQMGKDVEMEVPIIIENSSFDTLLLRFTKSDFYSLLRKKLNWKGHSGKE
ncbi:NAD(+)/NADH kinase [Candidatus Calescamantes bacterium]|nr:NAD(+)/NADH kinase [Candidatus Calescamantes bacterium]